MAGLLLGTHCVRLCSRLEGCSLGLRSRSGRFERFPLEAGVGTRRGVQGLRQAGVSEGTSMLQRHRSRLMRR